MNEQTTPLPEPQAPRARHPVSIAHLVVGVALLGLSVIWALATSDVVGIEHTRFLLPAPWIVAGAAGLAGLLISDRRALAAQRSGRGEPPPPTT